MNIFRWLFQKLYQLNSNFWSSCDLCMHCNMNIYYDFSNRKNRMYCRENIGYFDEEEGDCFPDTCHKFAPTFGSMWYILRYPIIGGIHSKFVQWGWTFWTPEERRLKGRKIQFKIEFGEAFKQRLEDEVIEMETEFQLDEDGEINTYNMEPIKHPLIEHIEELNKRVEKINRRR